MDEFREEVDKALILKVTPKSDSSFHTGALEDFFNKSDIKINNKLIHELIDLENNNIVAARVLALSNVSKQRLIICIICVIIIDGVARIFARLKVSADFKLSWFKMEINKNDTNRGSRSASRLAW